MTCLPGLFGKEKQPFNATPFSGLVFLLTYVEKSKDLKEEEKTILKNPDLTSDDSSVERRNFYLLYIVFYQITFVAFVSEYLT